MTRCHSHDKLPPILTTTFTEMTHNMNITGRHIETGNAIEVGCVAGRIASLKSVDVPKTELAELPWIAPPLFDIQVNGANDIWFSDEKLTVDEVANVLQTFRQHGVQRLFPTLITNSSEALCHGFDVIRQACEQESWINDMVAGCHLEGPFISAEDGPRGAHPLQHVRGCDWIEFQKWQQASGNRIKLVTLAPESAGAPEFIRQFTESGGVCAIGHTSANSHQIAAAVDAGASLSTHFGNGAHARMPRHPNYLWDQLAEPQLWASLITDGHHIPASVVRSVLLAKGQEKVLITCDSSGLAGCPPGVYDAAGGQCEVLEDGRVVVAGQREYLAGSGAFTDDCVLGMIHLGGISLAEAWAMASANPARMFGVRIPRLEVGELAELVAFHIKDGRCQFITEAEL
ncbi:MAG: N-acetylglucosamine-6-phosphate deacetylase [Planctomycetaceae bacterium]